MNWLMILLYALGAMIATPVWGGYRDMLREWEGYGPNAFYDANVRPRPIEEITRTPSDADFEAQVEEIKRMKIRWEKAIEEIQEGEAFYTPDSTRIEALGSTATDRATAETVIAADFSLEDLETMAILRNPGIKEAERKLRGSIERYAQVWNLDEILRQYTAFTEDLMTGIGPMKGREPVEIKFPFPGILSLKAEIVNQEVVSSREGLEIARRTAVTGIRNSYWDLLFIRRAQGITREMVGLLQHLEAVAITRYEAGKTSFQDVIKVRIERETVEEDLITLAESQHNLEVKILELLDLSPSTNVGAPIPREPNREVPDLKALYTLAMEKKQELRRLRAMVGKMERTIELVETAIYPAYTLNLSLFQDEAVSQVGTLREREPFGVSTTASVGAGLPKMPWYGSNDAYVRETRQKLQALRSELRKAEDATMNMVRQAWFSLDRARREESLYAESVVNLSQAALEVSTRGYETGEVSFADVIASYTKWLMANLTMERKRSDLGVNLAELEEAVGTHWQ